jgi:hypothetical protein
MAAPIATALKPFRAHRDSGRTVAELVALAGAAADKFARQVSYVGVGVREDGSAIPMPLMFADDCIMWAPRSLVTSESRDALRRELVASVDLIHSLESEVIAVHGDGNAFLAAIGPAIDALGFAYPGEIPCDCKGEGEFGHHWACGYVDAQGRSPRDQGALLDAVLAAADG